MHGHCNAIIIIVVNYMYFYSSTDFALKLVEGRDEVIFSKQEGNTVTSVYSLRYFMIYSLLEVAHNILRCYVRMSSNLERLGTSSALTDRRVLNQSHPRVY